MVPPHAAPVPGGGGAVLTPTGGGGGHIPPHAGGGPIITIPPGGGPGPGSLPHAGTLFLVPHHPAPATGIPSAAHLSIKIHDAGLVAPATGIPSAAHLSIKIHDAGLVAPAAHVSGGGGHVPAPLGMGGPVGIGMSGAPGAVGKITTPSNNARLSDGLRNQILDPWWTPWRGTWHETTAASAPILGAPRSLLAYALQTAGDVDASVVAATVHAATFGGLFIAGSIAAGQFTGYYCMARGGVALRVFRVTADAEVQILLGVDPLAAGDTIRLTRTGTTIEALLNGVSQGSVIDATHGVGSVGLVSSSAVWSFTDWLHMS